jgi:type I restriction-modification system DNA methylase subunit
MLKIMDKEQAREQIKKLVEKYGILAQEKRISKYNEEMTKKDFILPLFRALGWDVENSAEVSAEEKISKGRVDYSFRINGIPKFFLEAKAMKVDLNDPKFIEQAINYSWLKGCTWAVLTDFEEVKIYNAEWKMSDLSQNMFFAIGCSQFLDDFERLWLLSRESFEQGRIDREAERWGKKSKRSPVGEQLLNDFTRFRELLSKNILKLNKDETITEEDLDEAVQRLLDRLIFIRNCEDRGLEEKQLLSALRMWNDKEGEVIEGLRTIFGYFDHHYNSKIFSNHRCDHLQIDNATLSEAINGLYGTWYGTTTYDFSAIEADVLGNIYEQYLGHILKKTEKVASVSENHAHRKEQGIYYTPTYIVDYIVKNTVGELLKEKKIDVEKIRILDPACGSGSFLIKAFDALNGYYNEKEGGFNQAKLDVSGQDALYTRRTKILQNNIFGVDLDKQAVEIAQLNLLLKIAEKGHKLPLLQQNIKQGNSLIDDPNVAGARAFKWEEEFQNIMNDGGFDVVIGNPPYVRIQTLEENSVNFFNSHYKSATRNYDIYAIFVEKGLSLLKEGGILGFILPSKFFNADYGEGLRKIIAENKLLYKIVDFKDFQIFEGATTYTCLMFLKKAKNKSFDYLEIANKNELEKSKNLFSDVLQNSEQKQPNSNEPWSFVSNNSKSIMSNLEKIKLKLGGISSELFVGLQTSADPMYIVQILGEDGNMYHILNRKTGSQYKIEKDAVKKILMGKDIRRWTINWRNLGLLFPYLTQANKANLIEEENFRKTHPLAWQYLLDNKKYLDLRENGSWKNKENWHAYVYEKNLASFSQRKILTQVLSSKNSFTFDEKGEFYFVGGGNAGGYGIVLKNEYSEKYHSILALLNSKLLEFYLKKISTPFRGGFYSYGKRFIERLPIIIPSGEDEQKLSEFSKKQLERNKRLAEISYRQNDEVAQLEEEIKKTDAQIDDIVYKIYGITDEERKVIEGSLK